MQENYGTGCKERRNSMEKSLIKINNKGYNKHQSRGPLIKQKSVEQYLRAIKLTSHIITEQSADDEAKHFPL